MTLNTDSKMSQQANDVNGLTKEEKTRIFDFLQGAIYSWCKNRPDEWFGVRDLVGGENYNWYGTPLMALYQKHIDSGKTENDAVTRAGIDCGRILKKVIMNDKRNFKGRVEFTNQYLWQR